MSRADSGAGACAHTSIDSAALRSRRRSFYTMKLVALLILLVVQEQRADSACETISVQNKPHRKEILASGLNRPYQLSIFKKDHKIFFSYNVGKNEEDTFEIGYIERGKNNVTVIKEVTNGFASAVDQERRHVYLGGSSGIYRYHLDKKKHEALEQIVSGRNIWYMFFKEHLYFIDYPSQKLYKFNTNQAGAVPERQKNITEKVLQYVIDADGDEFITNASGLYRIDHVTHHHSRYSDKGALFRGVALNNERHAYFCGGHSIYVPDKKKHSLKEIASVRNIFGITFDEQDNIIYANPDQIIKLIPGRCK